MESPRQHHQTVRCGSIHRGGRHNKTARKCELTSRRNDSGELSYSLDRHSASGKRRLESSIDDLPIYHHCLVENPSFSIEIRRCCRLLTFPAIPQSDGQIKYAPTRPCDSQAMTMCRQAREVLKVSCDVPGGACAIYEGHAVPQVEK